MGIKYFYLLFIFCGTNHPTKSQDEVFTKIFNLRQGEQLQIKCASGNLVKIIAASQRKTETDEKPTNYSQTDCILQDVRDPVRQQCDSVNQCEITLNSSVTTRCHNHTGWSYLLVSYKCVLWDTELCYCLNEEVPVLSCPKNHLIMVQKAGYYITNTTSHCDYQDSCLGADITKPMFVDCLKKDLCVPKVHMNSLHNCEGHKGLHYVYIAYKCEPLILKMLDDNRGATFSFCSDVRWRGALAFLWNPAPSAVSASTNTCSCTVSVPKYTHIETTTSFYLPPITNYTAETCNQTITYSTESGSETICSSRDVYYQKINLAVQSKLHIQYKHWEQGTPVFLVKIQVNHEENLTLTCGSYLNPTAVGLMTTVNPRQTTSNTKTSPEPTKSTRHPLPTTNKPVVAELSKTFLTPVITGCVTAIIILLIVVSAVTCFQLFKRRKKKSTQRAFRQELNQFAFENSIYMVANRIMLQGQLQGQGRSQHQANQIPVEPIYATIEPQQSAPQNLDTNVWYNIQSRLGGQVHFAGRQHQSSMKKMPASNNYKPDSESSSSIGGNLPDVGELCLNSQIPVEISDTKKLVDSVDVLAI